MNSSSSAQNPTSDITSGRDDSVRSDVEVKNRTAATYKHLPSASPQTYTIYI